MTKKNQNPKHSKNSLYNWQTFKQRKLRKMRNIMLSILQDEITLYDMFWQINEFINFNNKRKDNMFAVEDKLNGLNKLFLVGRIDDQEDRGRLFNMMYNTIHETRTLPKTVEERAEAVEKLLRVEVLNCI